MKHFWFVISLLWMTIVSFAVELKTIYEWKFVDYQWKSPQEKQKAIDSGNYNYASLCALYDVDKAPDGRLFVTSVREKGVPASVMTVTNEMGEGGPLLRPYPNWSWYTNYDDTNTGNEQRIDNDKCRGITSVYQVYIKDDHLFVLDCGKIGGDQVCPAQLLVFNLSTDRLIKRVIIPHNIASNKNGTGLLTTITVFVPHCKDINDAIVLMADTKGYGLVLFDSHTSTLCRIESGFMKPTDTIINIENTIYSLDDGTFSMTTVDEKLYFTPSSGDNMYKMKIEQSECLSNESEIDKITELAGILSDQTGPIASKNRAIFYSDISEMSIMCADTCKEINSNNSEVVAQDSEKLQFTSGMKAVYPFKPELLILTNRYDIIDTLDINEINFRVFSMDIEEMQNETNCFDCCNKKEKHKICNKPPHKNKSPKKHKSKHGRPIKYYKDKRCYRPTD